MNYFELRQKIKRGVKLAIKSAFGFARIGITSHSNLANLHSMADKNSTHLSVFLFAMPPSHYEKLWPLISLSKSEYRQDLFVLSELSFKRMGYFVEFGATNGIDSSNSHLLEKEFAWQGILAEPSKRWHKELHKNRPDAVIEERCVWKVSNSRLLFNETSIPELSTIDTFSGVDCHKALRHDGQTYEVEAISLNDLLHFNKAPLNIDYLSIDTEGSEFEILNALDFEKYNISIITCEHNFTPTREKIYRLLTAKGYERKYEHISHVDDWYVRI